MKGGEVFCFSVCYLIAFLFELTQLRFKSQYSLRVLYRVFLCFGIVLHGITLYTNDLLQNNHFFVSIACWFYVLGFSLALVTGYLTLVYNRTQFGLFLLPLTLIVLLVGQLSSDADFSTATTCRCVRAIHAGSFMLSTLFSLIGTIAGTMFFLQRRRLKNKIFATILSLPSLEWLGYATRHSANVALVFLGIGVGSGFYLKRFATSVPVYLNSLDLVAIGATALFILSIIFQMSLRFKKGLDINAGNATLTFISCVALIILLLFAAFKTEGHWLGLVEISESNITVPIPNKVPQSPTVEFE